MDELVPAHDVSQLIGSAQLDPAAVQLMQTVEVKGLEELVGELGEAHALRALQPRLDAVSAEHRAHPKTPADLREKLQHVPVLVPAAVIEHRQPAQPARIRGEVQLVVGEDPVEALQNPAGVLLHRSRGESLSLGRPPARIPDLRRGSAEQRDYAMSRGSEVQQADDSEQVPGVKAVRGRVEAAVDGLRTGPEQIRELSLSCVLRERLLQEASVMQG